ncbi:MAG: diadenylate cyclase CdaA [Eubacteriaceae bacterium]|jgi:diadenylate cyclase|nr:diadenylate cyclase CdaA [Eubacteriaceae bacterium]
MSDTFYNLVAGIGVNDIIDIALVAFVIYKVLGFIRESRAEQLVQGLLILVLATWLSGVVHLYTINWLLKSLLTVGILALIVVFQPELRRGLEQMGRGKIMRPSQFGKMNKEKSMHVTHEFVKAIEEFSSKKVGALIIIERQTSLSDICETGTIIDAEVSANLLGNLFYEGSPLHDGAVVIRGDRIHAAGCVLPLTANMDLPSELGTRHRAGIGITEKSDCLTLIVSEETGIISIARDGRLERYLDEKAVEKTLLSIYLNQNEENKKKKKTAGGKNRGDGNV